MTGYKVSRGKKKIVYVYENVITDAERATITEFYLPAGYKIEKRVKDVAGLKKRAEERGFYSPAAKATKKEMLDWIAENDSAALKKWEKNFKTKEQGGLGFAKAKAEFRKAYPNYPEK